MPIRVELNSSSLIVIIISKVAKMNKVLLLGESIFLIIGALAGLISGIPPHHSTPDEDRRLLSATTKPVSSVCSQTDHKKACIDSVSSLSNNVSANPNDYLRTAINVAIKEVQAAMNRSLTIGQKVQNPLEKMAVDDCKELLDYAVEELQASYAMVGNNKLKAGVDREAELKNWLSAVLSYQQTCIDGFITPELKNAIKNGLLSSTKLTENALGIVSSLSHIFKAFRLPFNVTSTSRKFFDKSSDMLDKNGFPTWFHAGDRRLMTSQNSSRPPPDTVVAQDGSGQYRSINDALAAYPSNLIGRYVIYVKEGVYNEYVIVSKKQINVYMYGDGPRRTIVTGKKCFRDGTQTFQSASFSAIGDGFIANSMGFQNTAGPDGHQAVALRVQSDQSAFFNCRMDGYQDTLYIQTHRQFYRNCVISGTVDFIFGDSAAIIQNSLIIVRRPMDNQQNTVTAQGRSNNWETTGVVIQNCRIVPDQLLEPVRFQIPTYLGRPWKAFSRAVIMESTLADFIQPVGWMPWDGDLYLDTLYFAEYENRGPGATTDKRVNWKGFHVITDRRQAAQFTAGVFIQGGQWLNNTGSPFYLGFNGVKP